MTIRSKFMLAFCILLYASFLLILYSTWPHCFGHMTPPQGLMVCVRAIIPFHVVVQFDMLGPIELKFI